MDPSTFTNPLGAVQIISIFSCMNSLSDVLFADHFLNKTDQHKPIPVVNALYHYLLDENDKAQLDVNGRKLRLAGKLGNACKQDKKPSDPHSVNRMLDHVIESLVFEKYGDVNGFIAYYLLSSSDYSNPLSHSLKEALKTMKFKNDKGEIFALDELAVQNIFQGFIKPLLKNKLPAIGGVAQRHRGKRSPWASRSKIFSQAVKMALSNTKKLSNIQVENELKKYAFQAEPKSEMNFVKEWTSNADLKVPAWAAELKIEDPDDFFIMKYKETMDNPELELTDAYKKIDALYPVKLHPEIRKNLPVEQVLKDFKLKKAYIEVTFEDYYALRWYGDDGYKRMSSDTKYAPASVSPSDISEAKRMKNAIYRLAMRQSLDPSQEYPPLYRGESRDPKEIEEVLSAENGEFEFNRFTSSSTDSQIATSYSLKCNDKRTRVKYVMSFQTPFVRARVEHLFVKDEKETILLPGTKFHIVKRQDDTECEMRRKFITVEITHLDKASSILEQQKRIMMKIKELMDSGVKFYVVTSSN